MLERRLKDALEQHTAVSEILRVISRTQADVQPVLDAIAENAARYCRAEDATVMLPDGDVLRAVAHFGPVPLVPDGGPVRAFTYPIDRGSLNGRAFLERRVLNTADVTAEAAEFPHGAAAMRQVGSHAGAAVPLLRDGTAIGTIALRRKEARAFTAEQLDLLKTFADQAVIAIENVRLFNETKEALEQRTALADVLEIISRSPFDVQPVLSAVIEKAVTLSGSTNGTLMLRNGDDYTAAAHAGLDSDKYAQITMSTSLRRPAQETLTGRVHLARATIQIPDNEKDPDYQGWAGGSRARRDAAGLHHRGLLGVPLLRDRDVVGVIVLRRTAPGEFLSSQVKLIETFAAQAVIALENVRLFNETKESLEQQTAVAEVLKTISRSAFDLQPVLDVVVENAARLCDAQAAWMTRIIADEMIVPAVARYGVDSNGRPLSEFQDEIMSGPAQMMKIGEGSVMGMPAARGRTVHTDDLINDPVFSRSPFAIAIGARSAVGVPMLREGRPIGVLVLARFDVRPFTEREMQLAETFADQAAIAIENVRLFNETNESLEQQTAIADILRVMTGSPTHTQPIFDAIAASAARFAFAEDASVLLARGGQLVPVAHDGPIPMPLSVPIDRDSVSGRALLDVRTIHAADVTADDEYPMSKRAGVADGQRTVLAAPLVRGGTAQGVIVLRRREPRPFSDRQIQLAQTFADQAAIAIENVRLFNETKGALAQQTAVADVLASISRSAFDLRSVLDTVVSNAVRLTGADDAWLAQVDDDPRSYRVISVFGPGFDRSDMPTSERWARWLAAIRAGQPLQQRLSGGVLDHMLTSGRVSNFEDIAQEGIFESSRIAQITGARSVLAVPLRRGTKAMGGFIVSRHVVRPFTEAEAKLIETFADQASIAIENVRLFNETKEALEQRTAVAEILQVIANSPTDMQPVLDAIASAAARYCGAENAHVTLLRGDELELVAHHGPLPLHKGMLIGRDASISGRAVREMRLVHDERVSDLGEPGVVRTMAAMPLLRGGEPIGALVLRRAEVRAFEEKHLALLRTFADQAAIAIENVRLFNETKEALEQQRAVAEVLKTISRSVFDLRPVLDTVVENAARLAQADMAWLSQMIGEDEYKVVAQFGEAFSAPEVAAEWRHIGIRRVASSPSLMGRVLRARQQLHVADISADPELLQSSPLIRATGARTVLAVPMLREGRPIGGVVAGRVAVRPFSEREIELVQTFADQAAIAIENVRLFNEIQDKSRQLEVASRHKSEFLANMSHELRTPLNAIIGFTDVMLQEMFGPLNEKQKEYLEDVRSSGNHLLTLINDILDLSKIEAGRVDLELSEFSLAAAIDNALTLVRERAARHGITVASEVTPEIGNVIADERKLKQIVVNLLSNAVKFTQQGGWVGITARCHDDHVEVAVRDTGIGIAPEDQGRVFEEFQQVGKDPDRSREGTGLGLSLAKRYVELHGGRIWVESDVGKGSTFTFSIPVRQTAAAQA